ncbi:MAG: arginase family protein [Candidatus Limnocylindria bacterium]
MSRRLDIIGAPSSAGAYAPGQERAPQALRAAGLVHSLERRGVDVRDRGDVPGLRWRLDRSNPRAMNAEAAASVASAVAERVAESLADGAAGLVIGGDCTVELGTVAGATVETDEVGLVYVDLDTDLNTPQSVDDGALDWMGVAHMLALDDTIPVLTGIGPRTPMLDPDQVLLFANDNSRPFERRVIDERSINEVRLATVAADPAGAAQTVAEEWARQFARLLVHVDVDVLDYVDFPIAENTRRNHGRRFPQLVEALRMLVGAPNWAALTICEINPEHAGDESTLVQLGDALADVLAGAVRGPRP